MVAKSNKSQRRDLLSPERNDLARGNEKAWRHYEYWPIPYQPCQRLHTDCLYQQGRVNSHITRPKPCTMGIRGSMVERCQSTQVQERVPSNDRQQQGPLQNAKHFLSSLHNHQMQQKCPDHLCSRSIMSTIHHIIVQ